MDLIRSKTYPTLNISLFQSAFFIHICIVDDRSAITEEFFSLVQTVLEIKEITYRCNIPWLHHLNPILSR